MKDSPQQEEQETFFFNFRNKAIADVKLTRCLEGGVKVKALNPVEGAHSSDPPAEWPRSSTADPAGTV